MSSGFAGIFRVISALSVLCFRRGNGWQDGGRRNLETGERSGQDIPEHQHNITPELLESAVIASIGPAYAVSRANKVNRWGFMANIKWLAKLGVSAPNTIDEFYALGKKVAAEAPNGNGQNDTYLISPDGDVWGDAGIIRRA
jgi:hypothetical protein